MWSGDGDGPEYVGVEDREQGGVDSQAESDGADHRQSEAGRPADSAPGVANVLRERIEPDESPRLAALLEGQCLAAEEAALPAGRAIIALHVTVDADFLCEVGFEL